ncbi:MAG: permease [Spirochaetales bacterium]|nr:permease [Spirochaetales bacterium]
MIFVIFTAVAVVVSFMADRKKTLAGLKKGLKKLGNITPVFLFMLILASLGLTLLPEDFFARYLTGENRFLAALAGILGGSVAVMPGFIAFPLGEILRDQGVPYMVIAAFTSSLMMVGILTFPVERQFFGTRLALARNLSGMIISACVALAMGLVFGELF